MMANTRTPANSWRLLLALAVGAAACWLVVSRASAHAAYESSAPGFAQVLNESPSEISIRFTQELFRREGANTMKLARTTSPDVLDEYELGPVRIGNSDRKLMSAVVPVELPPGRYAVTWNNLSAEDGDEDSGRLIFYVSTEPEPWQMEEDRQIAQELLITLPGDQRAEPDAADSPTPATPTVVRAVDDPGASLGVGPLIWLAFGVFAGLVVVGALGYHMGRRGQAG